MGVKLGKYYRIKGRVVEILGQSRKTGQIKLNYLDYDELGGINPEDIVDLISLGEADEIPDPNEISPDDDYLKWTLDDLDKKTRDHGQWLFDYVEEALQCVVGKPTRKKLLPVIDRVWDRVRRHRKPHWETIQKCVKRARKMANPDIICCIPRNHLKGNRDPRFDAVLKYAFDEALAEHHYIQEPKSTWDMFDFFIVKAKKWASEAQLPSRRTFYRRMEAVNDKEKRLKAQRDDIEAEAATKPKRYGPNAERILHVVEIDHNKLDIAIIDTVAGVIIQRPWVTLVIDRYSRMILGFHIGYEAPSAHTVLLALKHSVFSKSEYMKQFTNIVNDWPTWGSPEFLVCDNGVDLLSKHVEDALKYMGTMLVPCPKLKAWFKGLIESTFRNISAVMRTMKGKTDSNYIKNGRYKSKIHATFTLDFLENYITKWIVDLHQFRPKKRLMYRSPRVVWDEDMKVTKVRAPYNRARLEAALMCVEWRSLKDRRIHMHGLYYSCSSPEFAELLRREYIPDLVKVKYSVEDIGYVHVEDWLVPGKFIPVPCDGMFDYADGLPLSVHKLLQEFIRRDEAEYNRAYEEQLRAAKIAMWEWAVQVAAEGKLTDRRLRALIKNMERQIAQTPIPPIPQEVPEPAVHVQAAGVERNQQPIEDKSDYEADVLAFKRQEGIKSV